MQKLGFESQTEINGYYTYMNVYEGLTRHPDILDIVVDDIKE